MSRYGTLNKSYHLGRETKKALKYRLNRRTKEVIRSINEYYFGNPKNIVDLGTADSLMLSTLKNKFPSASCVGIEYSRELVKCNTDGRITVLQGDVNYLPLQNNSFDIVIGCAIIEHLPSPQKMLEEARRILKLNGLIILTFPDPFWDRVATIVGHLPDEQHYNTINLKEAVSLLNEIRFEVLEQTKFMLSPVGMPLEIPIEKIVRSIGLNSLFANQLVVGKKIGQ